MRVRPRPNGKFVTLRQAEAELGIPYARLYEWVREGKLPHLDQDTVGRTYLIKRSDLEAFLDANMTAVR